MPAVIAAYSNESPLDMAALIVFIIFAFSNGFMIDPFLLGLMGLFAVKDVDNFSLQDSVAIGGTAGRCGLCPGCGLGGRAASASLGCDKIVHKILIVGHSYSFQVKMRQAERR